MAAAWIVEALDEFEDRATCFGLCFEPTPIEQLAIEGCEETLAHGVVPRVRLCRPEGRLPRRRPNPSTDARRPRGSDGRTRSKCIANLGRSDGSRLWGAAPRAPCSRHRAPVAWRAWWPS